MTEQQTALTQQQLADIEARANAATDGPWGVYTFGGDSLIEIAADLHETGHGYSARRTIARFDEEPLDNDPAHREWTAEEDWEQVQADAAFVAAARTDVPALLAEVRRLRAELDRRTEGLAFLERNTLPELRRDVEHHQAGKQRWRERAERAEARVAKTLCTEADEIVAHCPDHGSKDGVWMDCHCAVADDMRRRAAAPAVSGAADSRHA